MRIFPPSQVSSKGGVFATIGTPEKPWKSKTSRIKQIPKTSKPPTGPVYSTLLYSVQCVMRGMSLQQLQRPFQWCRCPRMVRHRGYPRGHWFPARGHCFPRLLEEVEGWNAHTFPAGGYCARRCPAGRVLVSCFAQEIQINGSKMKFPVLKWSLFWGHVDFRGGGGVMNFTKQRETTVGRHSNEKSYFCSWIYFQGLC